MGISTYMGQYFKIINLDKLEYIQDSMKFWELIASEADTKMLGLLLRQSNEGGGGDYHFGTYEIDEAKEEDWIGRWAGDRIAIIGDYDKSGLYQQDMHDITQIIKQFLKPFIDS